MQSNKKRSSNVEYALKWGKRMSCSFFQRASLEKIRYTLNLQGDGVWTPPQTSEKHLLNTEGLPIIPAIMFVSNFSWRKNCQIGICSHFCTLFINLHSLAHSNSFQSFLGALNFFPPHFLLFYFGHFQPFMHPKKFQNKASEEHANAEKRRIATLFLHILSSIISNKDFICPGEFVGQVWSLDKVGGRYPPPVFDKPK